MFQSAKNQFVCTWLIQSLSEKRRTLARLKYVADIPVISRVKTVIRQRAPYCERQSDSLSADQKYCHETDYLICRITSCAAAVARRGNTA